MHKGKMMKTKINNKLFVLTTMSAMAINGCTTTAKNISDATSMEVVEGDHTRTSTWNNRGAMLVNTNTNENCVNCVVEVPGKRSTSQTVDRASEAVYSYEYSDAPIETDQRDSSKPINRYAWKSSVLKQTNYAQSNDDSYDEKEEIQVASNHYPTDEEELLLKHTTKAQQPVYTSRGKFSTNPVIGSFSNKTSIQVGAFRKYAGAKVYAKKYDLSDRYNVEIKKNVKDNKPLYRVHIVGFSNSSEAEKFI